jgi:DNA-binding IclR family transcriptional regulator
MLTRSTVLGQNGGVAEAVLRGLGAMEAVGAGARTITDVARTLDVDKSTASRLVASLVREGWLHRADDGLDLGPRAAVLGVGGPEQQFVEHARGVAHAVAGVTGRHVTVIQHAGARDFLVAEVPGQEALFVAPNVLEDFPLWATAAGKCIAAQLDDAELDVLLPPEPFPALTPRTITTRVAFDDAVASVRAGAPGIERGEYDATCGCLALPWPGPEHLPVGVIGCVSRLDTLDADLELLERVLRAAVQPGATREQIVAAAAGE